jgi:hypothetical protein
MLTVERQEDACRQEHDEGVQGDLAQHEGPVIREDLVEEDPAALGHAQTVVELTDDPAHVPVGAQLLLRTALRLRRRGAHVVRSQKPGPIG